MNPPGNVIAVQASFDAIVNFDIVETDTLVEWVVVPVVDVARDVVGDDESGTFVVNKDEQAANQAAVEY